MPSQSSCVDPSAASGRFACVGPSSRGHWQAGADLAARGWVADCAWSSCAQANTWLRRMWCAYIFIQSNCWQVACSLCSIISFHITIWELATFPSLQRLFHLVHGNQTTFLEHGKRAIISHLSNSIKARNSLPRLYAAAKQSRSFSILLGAGLMAQGLGFRISTSPRFTFPPNNLHSTILQFFFLPASAWAGTHKAAGDDEAEPAFLGRACSLEKLSRMYIWTNNTKKERFTSEFRPTTRGSTAHPRTMVNVYDGPFSITLMPSTNIFKK